MFSHPGWVCSTKDLLIFPCYRPITGPRPASIHHPGPAASSPNIWRPVVTPVLVLHPPGEGSTPGCCRLPPANVLTPHQPPTDLHSERLNPTQPCIQTTTILFPWNFSPHAVYPDDNSLWQVVFR